MAYAEIERVPHPPNSLSKPSLASLAKLESLSVFPDVKWETHDGDVPHGEDPSQNDGHWKAWIGKLNGGKGAFWVRANIEIPKSLQGYELKGASLIVNAHASPAGAVPEILYLDGRRIALGTDLEPEVLSDSLEPGQKYFLALKLLSTIENKTIQHPELTLRFSPDRPDPEQFRSECLSAAVLLPTLDKDPNVLATDVAVIEHAVGLVDFDALNRNQQEAFDLSLRKAEELLTPLKPKLQTLKIDAVGNSHIDAAWKWTWPETLEVVKDTFTTALQLMPEYPGYKYTQPDMQYDDWMEKRYPARFTEIQNRTKEGRWVIVGGMWAEPDLNEPDGETMTRELLIGKRYVQSRFGEDVKIGWNVDSFGYSWQLPQVYKKSGVDFFVTQKMNWNEQNRLPLKLFWWQSPDGSSILTYFPMSYNGTTQPVEMAEELANARPLAPGLTEVMHLYGVGDHGGGATRIDLDQAEKWVGGTQVYPKLSMSTPADFFASVAPIVSSAASSPVWNYKSLATGPSELPAATGNGISIPVWRDELYLETHRGTYTSQAMQKKNMRDSEEWLLDAEKLSSISWVLGGETYPQDALNDAWKKVLFNTNHDLAAGSGIAAIYKDAQIDYDAVHATTQNASQSALNWIAEHADTHGMDAGNMASLVVVNTLAWPRDGLLTADVQLPSANLGTSLSVRDAKDLPVPFQVLSSDPVTGKYKLLLKVTNVPSVGFEVLHVGPGKDDSSKDLRVDGTTLENALLRVVVDPKTGCVTHLISKASGYDSIANGGCGNQLQTFFDKSKKYDAWNIDADVLQKVVPIDAADSVVVVDKGPLRASVTIKRHWGMSHFEQTIVLYAGTNRVDIENDFDWHETHVLLKAAWPLRASSEKAAFEIPYGVIERPTTRENDIDKAKYEVPALRWADLGDAAHGVSLINNSKYGYDATAHLLRLSLLRAPIYPDPEADRGEQKFTYAVYPHAGTWQEALSERVGYEFNYPLTAEQVPEHDGTFGREHSFLEVQDPNVVLTAIKKSEDGNALIVRMYDWSGKVSHAAIQLPGIPLSASESDMLEHAIDEDLKLTKSTLNVTMHPFEIKTLRIEYGTPTK
jgi:alpha-mannosidase